MNIVLVVFHEMSSFLWNKSLTVNMSFLTCLFVYQTYSSLDTESWLSHQTAHPNILNTLTHFSINTEFSPISFDLYNRKKILEMCILSSILLQ